MIIYLAYSRGTEKETISKIKKLGLFSSITIFSHNKLKLKTKKTFSPDQIKKIDKIKECLLKIKTVKDFSLHPVFETPKESSPKIIHIFADVDSTLTRSGMSNLHRDIKLLIKKFKEQNCNFYFCSGRSYQNIDKLRTTYDTGEYGIAENGGMIIGLSTQRRRFGNREQPDRLIQHLQQKQIEFRIDEKQNNRMTEYVLLKNSISESALKAAIKKSKAKVEYHESKDTYHISKRNVNKGTAIEFLTGSDELDLNPDITKIIAIGDSDLDVPMFEQADVGYIVGIPTESLKRKINKLSTEVKNLSLPPKALAELYKDLFHYA